MVRNPSISLTEHQRVFIADLIASGRYQGVSEVVRAALRLLEEQEQRRRTVVMAPMPALLMDEAMPSLLQEAQG